MENKTYLTPQEIQDWKPFSEFPDLKDFKAPTRERMMKSGQWDHRQMAGKRWSIGCVSLEITQRCNLDCSLCYLSDMSEAVKDIPLFEVYRRIDTIYRHYGPGTDIQVSGGDPTLRKRDELVKIVKRITDFKMGATLFTNGILAKRDLLEELAGVGLTDVAFHVDMTQERKGYADEIALNEVRENYIKRAKGLGINIFFNTTVFEGNFHQIPDVAKFFCDHGADIQLASFQLQADTGRGVLRKRDFMITQNTVAAQISKGAGTDINFDVPNIGHPECNKYGIVLGVNGKMYNFLEDDPFLYSLMNLTADFNLDRTDKKKTVIHMLKTAANNPSLWKDGVKFIGRKVWEAKADLIKSKGKISKTTFFIHNFMDASELDKERCDSCSFMVMTPDGPISMCVFNAKRDDYILKALKVKNEQGEDVTWNPLTGNSDATLVPDRKMDVSVDALPKKNLKGRVKKTVSPEI